MTPSCISRRCRPVRFAMVLAGLVFAEAVTLAQSNPSPLNLPVTQTWGSTAFTSMPSGFAAWGGMNGGTTSSQALAEATVPTFDATVMGSTPTSGGTGGCYGYAVSSNARFAVNTSSNSLNGVNQLALAINTLGQSNITLTYDLINVIANARTVGAVCQYRAGTSGPWTTLSGTGNPYVQSGGTAGTVTSASINLPAGAENQPVVQIRWAVWRGGGAGNSSAFAIDNLSITGTAAGPLITSLGFSGGPTYSLAETAIATVTLAAAPSPTATVNVSSGAFATVPVTIAAPSTSGTAEVSMSNAGMWTATAAAVSGCAGSATSSGFTVSGVPAASFAATGNNLLDDSTGNGDGYLEPGEGGVLLTIQIVNNGTLAATGVSGTLTSLNAAVTINTAVRSYPDLGIGANGNNTLPFVISASGALQCGETINLQLAVTSNEGSSNVPVALTACLPMGSLYDPPADYYATATGTGPTLETNLHNIISRDYWNGFLASSSHNAHSYDDAKVALAITDVDPNNPANLILIYSGLSVPKQWDAGVTWNREHQWPDSQGINGALPAYSDLHHLRPCNPSLNSARGNKSFGIGGNYFDPDQGQACRGRVARSIFYMAVRYNGTSPSASIDLNLVDGDPPTTNQLGDKGFLLGWHYAFTVDEAERRRNQVVFSNSLNPSYYQGNRNPFVDHPEYVWAIWGTSANDTTLYVGGSPDPDGGSTANVNLGSVIVNGPMPGPQAVTLNKSGSTPTTYDITLSGAATSNGAGLRQAFVAGAGSRGFNAGLSSATSTPGLKSGTIVINNTDLTSADAGQGSADANDVINISESVLDHANASFTTPADVNTLTIDFGSIPAGSGVVTQGFAVHNLVGTPSFTAALDVTSVNGTGDTAKLYSSAVPFTDLPAGSNQALIASFDTAAVGSYSATWTLANADQILPGSIAGTSLTLTLVGVVTSPCNPTDANCSGAVDVNDVEPFVTLLLSAGAGACNTCSGDCNSDGRVDGLDVQVFSISLVGS